MTTQLETTAALTTADLFQNDTAQGRVDKISAQALEEVFDVTIDAGRKACISHAAKVTKTKTAIDKIGKKLSDSLSVESKKVLAERKIYRDGLDELKLEVRKPVTEWEKKEADKRKAIANEFEALDISSNTHDAYGNIFPIDKLETSLDRLGDLDLTVFGDQKEVAIPLIFAGRTKVKAAIQQRKDADELATLRVAHAAKVAEEVRLAEVKRIEEGAIAKHNETQRKKRELEAVSRLEDDEKDVIGIADAIGRKQKQTVVKSIAAPWIDPLPKTKTKLEVNAALIQSFCELGGIAPGSARQILVAIRTGKINNISINY